MRAIEQLELPLWDLLKVAAIDPDGADIGQLLDGLDQALSGLDTVGQLQVGAVAIEQIVQVFEQRSTLAFEELEAINSDEGPVMPTDAFDRYVRQTMEVDFDAFIEPLAALPRKAPERQDVVERESVVGALDQAALLQALDAQMEQAPTLTEADLFNRALALAHDEDVSVWSAAITQWLRQHRSPLPLLNLMQAVQLPLLSVWLGVLLSDQIVVEQRGQFYDLSSVWVSISDSASCQ